MRSKGLTGCQILSLHLEIGSIIQNMGSHKNLVQQTLKPLKKNQPHSHHHARHPRLSPLNVITLQSQQQSLTPSLPPKMTDIFANQQVHCQGVSDLAITTAGYLYSIGADDMLYQRNLKTHEEQRIYLDVPEGNYATIALHAAHPELVVLAGSGKTVDSLEDLKKDDIEFVYKLLDEVNSMEFSSSGRFLAIASGSDTAIVYDWYAKKGVKCRPGHTESVLSVWMSNNEKYICSTGTDGYLRVYEMGGEEATSSHTFRISKEINKSQQPKQALKGMCNPNNTLIACPGKAYLQMVEVHDGKFSEFVRAEIKHTSDITLCHWQTEVILVTTGLDNFVRIWNYNSDEQLIQVPNLFLTRIARYESIFYGINQTGCIFRFTKPEKLKIGGEEIVPENTYKEPSEVEMSQRAEDLEDEEDRKFVKKSKSKADKLITSFPQSAVIRTTEFFSNNRFLLYNTVGCIIERTDGASNSIELEYHDSKIINKRKSLFTDREMKYFDLQINRIAYANEREYGFFGDFFWEYQVQEDEEVQSICAGSEWVAVALESKVLVLDLAGNNIRNIAFDKSFIAMAAYEDLLAIVYIDSIPLWGCENLKMNVWNMGGINDNIENISIPLKPSSSLKAFGFSEEGLLYSQDSKGYVRVFSASARHWVEIVNPRTYEEEAKLQLWIVGMSNFELLGFKLNEGETEPTVLPRMYPRKVKISVPSPHNKVESYINGSKATFGEILWKRVCLDHEWFRSKQWYRYKFARSELNSNYNLSANIMSQEELRVRESSLDNDFMFLIKNFLILKEAERAFITAKTFIKSEKHLRKIIEVFSEAGLQQLATKVENHYDEEARLQQYDLAQGLRLKELRQEMEKQLNVKPIDPMNPKMKKLERGTSFLSKPASLASARPSQVSQNINQGNEEKLEPMNPFACKTPNDTEDKIRRDVDSRIEMAGQKYDKKKAEQTFKMEKATRREV